MGINVLSLCDGMSGGQLALEKAGIKVDKYFASEIKDVGIKVTMQNYPGTIQLGDLTKIKYKDGILYSENGEFRQDFDLVIFGSPCQTFSIACKTDKRIGLEDDMKSGLFFECYRILKEVNHEYFLMENVASMKKDDEDFITKLMGVAPLKLNADKILPCLRNRLYWTNIENINNLKEIEYDFNSILEDGWSDRKKARSLLVSDSRPLTTPSKMFHRYHSSCFTTLIFKSEQHYKDCVEEYEKISGGKRKITAKELDEYKGNIFDGVRYMNKKEREKCHGIKEGYTKHLTENEAANVIGDGWAIDVVAHIFEKLF